MNYTQESFRVAVINSADCPDGVIWLSEELQKYAEDNGYKSCRILRFPMIEKANTAELDIAFLKPVDQQYCVISTINAIKLNIDIDSGGDVITVFFGKEK